MQQVIVVEVSIIGERVNERERALRSLHHRYRHSPVQRHDGRGIEALEMIVEANDLGPVRIFGPRRLTVHGRDRRLQREWTNPAAKRLFDQWRRLGDLLLIPSAAILLLQEDEISSLIEAGVAPRIVKQHESE